MRRATATPGPKYRLASAESLPFTDDTFDASLAQLVVHFMTDPLAGCGDDAVDMARRRRRRVRVD